MGDSNQHATDPLPMVVVGGVRKRLALHQLLVRPKQQGRGIKSKENLAVAERLARAMREVLTLWPGADEPWFWALLAVAPSPAAQRRLTRTRVDHLLRAHRIRRWRAADVVARLQAPSFPHAPGVAEAIEARRSG